MAKYSEQTQSQIETGVTTRLLAQCYPFTGLPGKGAWPRGGPGARPVCYCLGVESRQDEFSHSMLEWRNQTSRDYCLLVLINASDLLITLISFGLITLNSIMYSCY